MTLCPVICTINSLLVIMHGYCFPISAKATFMAISKTYSFLTPDLWKETVFTKQPYEEYTDYLAKHHDSEKARVAA